MVIKPKENWALGAYARAYLYNHIPAGSLILELGSGVATDLLARRFEVVTVEHDEVWLHHSQKARYVHAPLVDGWYSVDALEAQGVFELDYKALIVDGPPGSVGRAGILNHLSLFRWDCVVMVDDCNRSEERELAEKLAHRVGLTVTYYADDRDKLFGILE